MSFALNNAITFDNITGKLNLALNELFEKISFLTGIELYINSSVTQSIKLNLV